MYDNAIRKDQTEFARRQTLGAKKAPAKRPFVAKGHDAILKSVQDKQGIITVVLGTSGDVVTGALVARDKFTITIRTTSHVVTIYKHAIEMFYHPAQTEAA